MVGGFAGQGVNTVGNTLARICSRAGLNVFVNLEYPSNIKGEHNNAQVMVSEEPLGSHVSSVDLLLALDAKGVILHKDEITAGGALIYDSEGLEVSPVDAGRMYLDEQLARTRRENRPLLYAQVMMFRFDSHVAALLGYLA